MDDGRESLLQFICRLYVEWISVLHRQVEQTRKKKAQLLASLAFLSRCRDENVIPKFLKSKQIIRSCQARRIYNRTEKALLRERIQNTRRNLAEVDKKLLGLFYQLSSKLHRSDWDKIDAISFRSMENELQKSTERQKNKFQRLTKNSGSDQTLDNRRTVINVSNRNLSQEEVSVLAKGGNFAITPKEIPKEEIIANLESALRFLPEEKAQELRTETARILKKAKPPKSNLKPREFKAIRELNKDENILVLPADKGNATVVINTEDYKRKINDLLDPGSYKELRSDPTQRIVRTTKTLIYKSDLGKEIRKRSTRTKPQCQDSIDYRRFTRPTFLYAPLLALLVHQHTI